MSDSKKIEQLPFSMHPGQIASLELWKDAAPEHLSEQIDLTYKAVLGHSYDNIQPIAFECDENDKFEHTLWKFWGDLYLPGATVHPDFGGSGMGYIEQAVIIQAISEYCGGIGLSFLANSVLCIHQINMHANDDQRGRHLPKLCSGEHHGALCITEPNHGSDAGGIQMKATKVDGGWLLNGSKHFITNGGTADKMVAYAKTGTDADKPNHLSAFIVTQDKDCQTIKSTKMKKIGMRASETWEMEFKDHFVPDEDVLGEIGNGLKIMFSGLPLERAMLAMQSIGLVMSSFQITKEYLLKPQFNKPIIEFDVAKHQLTQLHSLIEREQRNAYAIIVRGEKGRHFDTHKARYEYMKNKDGSLLKNTATEMAVHVTGECLTLCGGMGYTRDFKTLGRNWVDSKLNSVGGGAENICNRASWKDLGLK